MADLAGQGVGAGIDGAPLVNLGNAAFAAMPDLLTPDTPRTWEEELRYRFFYDPHTDSLFKYSFDYRDSSTTIHRLPARSGRVNDQTVDAGTRARIAAVAAAGSNVAMGKIANASGALCIVGANDGQGATVVYQARSGEQSTIHVANMRAGQLAHGGPGVVAGHGDAGTWAVVNEVLLDGFYFKHAVPLRYAELPCEYLLLVGHGYPHASDRVVWYLFDDSLQLFAQGAPTVAFNAQHVASIVQGVAPGDIGLLGMNFVPAAAGAAQYRVPHDHACIARFDPVLVGRMRDCTPANRVADEYRLTFATSIAQEFPLQAPAAPTLGLTWRQEGDAVGVFGGPVGGPNTTYAAATGCHLEVHQTMPVTAAGVPRPEHAPYADVSPRGAPHVGCALVPVGKPMRLDEDAVYYGGGEDGDEGDDIIEQFSHLCSVPPAGCAFGYTNKRFKVFRVVYTPWSRELHAGGWTDWSFRRHVREWCSVRVRVVGEYGALPTPSAAAQTATSSSADASGRAAGAALARLPVEVFEMIIAAWWDAWQAERLQPRHRFLATRAGNA